MLRCTQYTEVSDTYVNSIRHGICCKFHAVDPSRNQDEGKNFFQRLWRTFNDGTFEIGNDSQITRLFDRKTVRDDPCYSVSTQSLWLLHGCWGKIVSSKIAKWNNRVAVSWHANKKAECKINIKVRIPPSRNLDGFGQQIFVFCLENLVHRNSSRLQVWYLVKMKKMLFTLELCLLSCFSTFHNTFAVPLEDNNQNNQNNPSYIPDLQTDLYQDDQAGSSVSFTEKSRSWNCSIFFVRLFLNE